MLWSFQIFVISLARVFSNTIVFLKDAGVTPITSYRPPLSSPERIAKATPRPLVIRIVKTSRQEYPKEARNRQPHRIPQFFPDGNEAHFLRSYNHCFRMMLWWKESHVHLVLCSSGDSIQWLLYNLLSLLIKRLCIDGCYLVGRIFIYSQVGQRAFANHRVPDFNNFFQCRGLKASDGSTKVVTWVIFVFIVVVVG